MASPLAVLKPFIFLLLLSEEESDFISVVAGLIVLRQGEGVPFATGHSF